MERLAAARSAAAGGCAATGRLGPLLGCLLGLVSGCSGSPRVDTVVLIVIDTIRQDHMSVYGYERLTTPHLDRFAGDAVAYTRAYSQAPWTTPSIGSLLSSQYPSYLGIRGARSPLREDLVLLPEMLARAGFVTLGVVSNDFCTARWGFAQGFDRFDESNVQSFDAVTGYDVTRSAIEMLEAHRDDPVFLFVHYFDPHIAYVDHEEFSFRESNEPYEGPIRSGILLRELTSIREGIGDRDLEELRSIYDSEIALTDDAVGRLLAHLARTRRSDGALIVVTADHGEEFLERGWFGHAKSLHEELVRVPLLVRYPDVSAGRVDVPVALIDVYPTIAQVVGIEADSGLRGRVLPRVGEPVDDTRPVFTETSRRQSLRGVVEGPYKLIHDRESGSLQLFHLPSDPTEQRDLAAEQPERVAAMLRELDDWADRNRPAGPPPGMLDLTREEEERLRSLGYL